MREILFRGKRKDNSEWVYGYYSPVNVPIVGTMGHFINEDGFRAIEIIPETVGQFTGLIDKNGNKIFEDDIIKGYLDYSNNDVAVVEYEEESMKFCTVPIAKEDCGKLFSITDDVEIIGNAHDNPEILEVKE